MIVKGIGLKPQSRRGFTMITATVGGGRRVGVLVCSCRKPMQ